MSFVNHGNFFDSPSGDGVASLDGILILSGDFGAVALDNRVIGAMDGALLLSGNFEPVAFDNRIEDEIIGNLALSSDFAGQAFYENGLDGVLTLGGDFAPMVRVALVQPPPILTEIAENPFSIKSFDFRVLKDGEPIPVKSFTRTRSKNTVGAQFTVELAEPNAAQADASALYTIQIGLKSKPLAAPEWVTLLENGKLDSRNSRRAWLGNSLSFGASAPLSDALNRAPKSNIICFDPNKTEVSVSEIEPLADTLGGVIGTDLRSIPALSLYQLLNTAFVEGCGFDSVETSVPNFEITRLDIPFTNTFYNAIRGVLGIFSPLIFEKAAKLWVIDKTAAIPAEFVPRALSGDYVSALDKSRPPLPPIDGFVLEYAGGDSGFVYSADRPLTPVLEPNGTYGEPDYTETTIKRTVREWFDSDNPGVALKSELKEEIRETRNNSLVLTGRETQTNLFDGQGKRKGYTKTIEARVPSVDAGGTLVLLEVKRKRQETFYKVDPFNPRRYYTERTVTRTSGLVAVDSENKAITKDGTEEDFRQDYEEVLKAGNLTLEMTTEFGPLETIVESFYPLGNGQTEVRITGTNHLTDTPIEPDSEVRSGDISVPSVGSILRRVVVWKQGYTAEDRPGYPPIPLNGGELPLIFLKPLAERLLALRDNPPEEGTLTVTGFDPSIEKGVFFTLTAGAENLGRFVVEGDRLEVSKNSVKTELEISEI